MLLRQLEYLVALASERHFARAAERCCVSQPTLSAALRQLEDDLGTAIVERGNRFRGFTADGEIVLRWARRILADESGLKQELDVARGTLKGRLRLGVIPSANSAVPQLLVPFMHEHPQVSIDETEATSAEIIRGLAEFEFDAGVTYVDAQTEHIRALPIYDERYVAIVPATSPLSRADVLTWCEASTMPLCLLHRDMQNRRIYDDAFASVGCKPDVRVEVYSMMAKVSYLESGALGSIMPLSLIRWTEGVAGIRAIPLVEPEIAKTVALVTADRAPVPALIEALWRSVERRAPLLAERLAGVIDGAYHAIDTAAL